MQLRQELRLLVKGGEAANSARDAVAQRRLAAAIVLSCWSGGEPNLRFWISSVKGNAVSEAARLGLSMPVDQQFPQSEPLRFWQFWGTARLSASDYIVEGGARSERRGVLGRSFHPSQNNKQERENYMKKLLLIALVVSGLAFVPVQRSDAQVSVGIGGVGIGFGYPGYRYGYYGYPGYGYGYYPYGYYRSYPDYGYYTGRSYYGHRVYRHHRHHYYPSRY